MSAASLRAGTLFGHIASLEPKTVPGTSEIPYMCAGWLQNGSLLLQSVITATV